MARTTTDYSRFTELRGSRHLNEQAVYAMTEFARIPIQVTTRYEIVEGKHRFEACRLLGLPINYDFVETK